MRSEAVEPTSCVTITLKDEIACVRREIRLRKRVYPGLVLRCKMTEAEAEQEIAVMTAVLKRLEDLRQPPLFSKE